MLQYPFKSYEVILCTITFNINKFYILPAKYVSFAWISRQTVTCTFYSINSLVFYNRDGKCLLRGTHWLFTYKTDYVSSLRG
jgi:hypothetical protein